MTLAVTEEDEAPPQRLQAKSMVFLAPAAMKTSDGQQEEGG